jgi:hypothetical protein
LPVVTLTTDFGGRDGYVGVMKGVIWGICPEAQIADLSHDIAPQNISEAAYLIGRVERYFPDGTIHVLVVDPGVGTARRPMAARIGANQFVCPDNGLITLPLERGEREGLSTEIVELNESRFWLPSVSDVFHGRDIFAPCAAHLAAGTALDKLGSLIWDPVRLAMHRPERRAGILRGEVIHIDHFGNLETNLTREDLQRLESKQLSVRLGDLAIAGLERTFGEGGPGRRIALIGSSGNLIIAVVKGSAAAELGTKVGDAVEVWPGETGPVRSP